MLGLANYLYIDYIIASLDVDIILADPADRVFPDHEPTMLLECMEEGIIHWNKEIETLDSSQLLEVGTILGEIIDEDDDREDEDWKWQAYLHDD